MSRLNDKTPAQLSEEEAKTELARLAKEIAAHDKRYYQEDAPTVSDAEYDALRLRNEKIEKRFPELIRHDSPSQRVGAKPAERFEKVRHARPMLSLDNAFTEEDVRDFVARVRRILGIGPHMELTFVAGHKSITFANNMGEEKGARSFGALRGGRAQSGQGTG